MLSSQSSPARVFAIAFLLLFAVAVVAQDQQKVKVVSWIRIASEKVLYQGHSAGSSDTDCNGMINDFGSLASYSAHCTTRYREPHDTTVSKPIHDIYAVAEGGGRRYLLHCRENWRWSKCGSVVPGQSYTFETKGRSAWTQEIVADSKNVAKSKFDIVQVELIQPAQ